MSSTEQEVGGESPRLGTWGLWSLDLFEGTVRPPREAAAIERFAKIGEAFLKLSGGRVALTFLCATLDAEERILVEGPEPRLLFIEDMIGFAKMGEGFLEVKEELRFVRRRSSALLVLHKLALRLERSNAFGFKLEGSAPAESIHAFAMLLREPPLPDAHKEQARLSDEMRRRGLMGVSLLSKDALLAPDVPMDSAARVLLTHLSTSSAPVPNEALSGLAGSTLRLAGVPVAQEMVAFLDLVAQGPRLEAMQSAFLGEMEVTDLVPWRERLEEQGTKLAAQVMRESRPDARAALETRLKALSKLLEKVTDRIPAEVLAEAQAKRSEVADERHVEKLKQIAAGLLADPIGYLKKMSSEREKAQYERSLAQCIEAFPSLIVDQIPVARLVLQALQAHLRRVPEVPWRCEQAAAALAELATERAIGRFLALAASSDKPEAKDHARAALGYFGAAGLPFLAARLHKAASEIDAEAAAQQAVASAVMRDLGAAAEPFLAEKLAEPGATLPLVKVALDVLGRSKRPESFELVSRFATHADFGVRESALRALALIDPAKGQALIRRSIGDRDFAIARMAIALLGELKVQDPVLLQQFLETLKRRDKDVPEPDERLQIVTAQALGMVGNVVFKSNITLEDALLDLAQPQQDKKVLGLGGSRLRDKSVAVRGALCEALGGIGGDKALVVLRKLALNDPNEPVKAKARDAIRTISARMRPTAAGK